MPREPEGLLIARKKPTQPAGLELVLELDTETLCKLALGINKGWTVTCDHAGGKIAVEIKEIEFVRVGVIRAVVLFR